MADNMEDKIRYYRKEHRSFREASPEERQVQIDLWLALRAGVSDHRRALYFTALIRTCAAALPACVLMFLTSPTEGAFPFVLWTVYVTLEWCWVTRQVSEAHLAIDICAPAPQGND